MIGIVGGVGPYAGIDLLKNIYDNTLAETDQDYLNTLLFSLPSSIQDRTKYLLGTVSENPGFNIAKIILALEKSGATVAGIPCNTAHSDRIFSVISDELRKNESQIKVIHMINETVDYISVNYPNYKKIGILSTTGTYIYQLYANNLNNHGYIPIEPTLKMQEEIVHPAIYHPDFGIKSKSNPFHPQAKRNLVHAIGYLKDRGAEVIILGCSEIPLVIKTKKVQGILMINPTNILARKLIEHINPKKLKSFNIHGKKHIDLGIAP